MISRLPSLPQISIAVAPTIRKFLVQNWLLAHESKAGSEDHRRMRKSEERPGSNRLRAGRISIPGQPYLITFCTMHRRAHFSRAALARVTSTQLSDPELWRSAQLLAWVLMPDHFHGLVVLGDECISKLIQRVKAVSARATGLGTGVWMPGFHDHALRREEGVDAAAAYILMNPVRAGLACEWRDYPFAGTRIE